MFILIYLDVNKGISVRSHILLPECWGGVADMADPQVGNSRLGSGQLCLELWLRRPHSPQLYVAPYIKDQ